ncbi:uncharacterized protein LOC124261890 [Haliotis rubra]|uniref:uncharacterized protein LOC124261890 n=1 Tax=Haliotis rubra TaxID=36100 RepID=UPI001EE55AAF|nr:uncharacterized protein LOC124261890 [Haliotis rubra]
MLPTAIPLMMVTAVVAICIIYYNLHKSRATGDGFPETRGHCQWPNSGNNQTGRRPPDDTDGGSQYGKRANMSDTQYGRGPDINNAVCFENEGNKEISLRTRKFV